MKYFIHKASRDSTSPYAGPSCASAGLRPAKWYDSRAEAERDAEILGRYNPVGFLVGETDEPTTFSALAALVDNQTGEFEAIVGWGEDETDAKINAILIAKNMMEYRNKKDGGYRYVLLTPKVLEALTDRKVPMVQPDW